MASSTSSQFGPLLLFTVSIGTLLLIVTPQFGSALVCYKEGRFPPVSARAAWQQNKFANLTNPLLGVGTPTNGDEPTEQCATGQTHCAVLMCYKIGQDWVKGCVTIPPNMTPRAYLDKIENYCSIPPYYGFMGYLCNRDYCNHDMPVGGANAIPDTNSLRVNV